MPAGRGTRPLAAALAATALAGLAGCGSVAAPGAAGPGAASSAVAGTSTSGPGGTMTGGTGTGPATPGCTPADLRVRLDAAAAGVAAGTSYVPIEFTNTTSAPCTLRGFPAVALTSGVTGTQIGTEAAVDQSVPSASVTLAPGGTAHAWLGIASTANIPASACKPVTAAGLRVVAPGSVSASYLADKVPTCKKAVPGGGILMVHPVQAGRAQRGTA